MRHPLPASAQKVFLLLALLLLALPGLLTRQGDSQIDERQNRALAAWPASPADRASLEAWPAQAEAWLKDHVGLRSSLLSGVARLRLWLKEPRGSNVVFGRGDWLFFRDGMRLRAAAGGLVLPQAGRARLLALFQETRRAAGTLPLLFVIAPDKETMLSDALPWWARRFTTEPAMQRLLAELEAAGLEVLDLRATLAAAPNPHTLYFRQDTHWTTQAGYHAYRAIIASLRDRWPGLPLLGEGDVGFRDSPPPADLARMLGLPQPVLPVAHAHPAHPTARLLATDEAGTPTPVERFQRQPPGGAAAPLPRLLVLSDSFGYALRPWLPESFDQVVMASILHPAGVEGLLARYPSDLVIVLLVERNLSNPIILARTRF